MAVEPTKANAEAMARRMAAVVADLPEGMGLVAVLFTIGDKTFDAALLGNTKPQQFAPVLRRWLERYDRGEAAPG
jgi:hypothetical protein